MAAMKRRSVCMKTRRALRVVVFTRDAFMCRVCGWSPPRVPADYIGEALFEIYVKPNGRTGVRALELDHVIPHSMGGKFVESNLQTLCNSCNARKGARV